MSIAFLEHNELLQFESILRPSLPAKKQDTQSEGGLPTPPPPHNTVHFATLELTNLG